MDMKGEYRIPAPRPAVWAALNDVDVLKAAIPGCDSINKISDNQIEATVTAKVGPVKASFKGMVTLSDLDPPNGYTISGEGKGGVAGFAKGGAKVRLADAEGGGTMLSYDVTASVGGKLAQIGARLIDSTAKKLADEFFAKFGELAAAKASELAPVQAPAVQVTPPPASATVPPASKETVPPAAPAAATQIAAKLAAKPDPLLAHQSISVGGWLTMIAVLAVIVFGLWLIG